MTMVNEVPYQDDWYAIQIESEDDRYRVTVLPRRGFTTPGETSDHEGLWSTLRHARIHADQASKILVQRLLTG